MQFAHAAERALKNIIHYGDTDIFPFPFERLVFEDKLAECKDILLSIHKDFDTTISKRPPLTISKLNQVGYYGFRSATQIEPFWNAYYLACVIGIADLIEAARIPPNENTIFSYRYNWQKDKSALFLDSNWNAYRQVCLANAKKFQYVIQTDISDFYSRINHHKLDNELRRVAKGNVLIKRIMTLLEIFSNGYSYGVPVGGPASRILSELALNHIDKHLKSRGITFCRYSDDFTIFCQSESEAYNYLVLLAEKLSNEGLTLQKQKTKIISGKEFAEIHAFLDPLSEENADDSQKLLNISIRYDPYSSTAVEDYENLKDEINKIDIVNILSKEVNKTRIDQTVTKHAVNAIKLLTPELQLEAVRILLDMQNLLSLAPVFTTIMRTFRSVYNDLSSSGRNLVDLTLLNLLDQDSHLARIELNLNYIVQVLSITKSASKETALIKLFESRDDHLLRRQIIVTLGNWHSDYWLADIRKHFNSFSSWERRSFIYASYFLDDEGKHWRDKAKKTFDEIESLIQQWSSERFSQGNLVLS
jgi:Reverse transcriptase (RNA-dependent DNA polymerase)